ncbi:MAG: hypothetical protein KDC18_06895 [Alphaproteobacteria bacterium]|nr:hypothetical protein [Alphaproteobacteria bacterium]MCB9930258.1 hypothetical protein [Alphaproteobacteria bacterium]
MSRPAMDFSNRRLFATVGITLAAGLVAAAVFGASAAPWARPGSPLLQSLAIAGAVLLLVSFAAVLAKRFGRPGKAGFRAHVVLASLGLAGVLAHWSFHVIQFPTLLLLLLLALVALGVWSRSAGAAQMAGTFGRKHAAFAPPAPATRERLRALIGEKRAMLAALDPAASEATFSLQPRHWVSRPRMALAYQRLCDEELRLTGATAILSRGQRHWRLAHRLLAWGFVLGLGLHVLLVVFFAGYVAHGRAIYWWHLTAWNF